MPENYDHYITKNIKALYKRRLFSPIVYLIIVIVLWHVFSLTDLLFPVQLTDDVTLESAYRNDAANMHTTLTDLKFTGYTRNNFSGTSGYYYYTIRNDECIIVLLSPSTCEEGLPFIDEVTFTGKIKKSTVSFQSLLKNMSDDLGWTESGITSKVSGYYISEPDYKYDPFYSHIWHQYLCDPLYRTLYPVYFLPGTLSLLPGSRLVRQSEKAVRSGGGGTCNAAPACNGRYVYHRTLFY